MGVSALFVDIVLQRIPGLPPQCVISLVHAKLLIGRRQTIIAQVTAFSLPFACSGRLRRDDHVGLAASAARNQIIRDTT